MKWQQIIHYCSVVLVFSGFGLSRMHGQSYGLKAGGAISTVNGQEEVDNLQPGLQLGAYLKLAEGQRLYFKTELLFTHKGVRNWRGLEDIDRSRMNFIYAELPLMFGIEVLRRLHLIIGFQPSLLIYGHHRFEEGGVGQSNSMTRNLTTMDYSTIMGVEYFVRSNIYLGARYNHGFVPIQGRRGELDMGGLEPTLMTFQIFCGYRLK